MANFLASVGRARPTRNVLDVIQGGIALDQNQRRNQMTAADLAMSAEQLAQLKRQGEYQEKLREQAATLIPARSLTAGMVGGEKGPVAKILFDYADRMGVLDKSTGQPAISHGNIDAVGKALLEDQKTVLKISDAELGWYDQQHSMIMEELSKKPTDQKLLDAMAENTKKHKEATNRRRHLNTDIEKRDIEKAKLAETERHNKAMESTEKAPTEAELTQRAAKGDKEAQFLLDAMNKQAKKKGVLQAEGKIEGLLSQMGGLEGTTNAVLEGRETIENVKNTFGVPVQELVRHKVLQKDKKMDFISPREVVKNLTASLGNQEKQRGMMGSFVRNIQSQVNRVEEIFTDIDRWGIRALDLPTRELKKRLVGSGHEITIDAYLTEISNEINKLSQGSQASIAQLGEESQKRWNAIHDPALSLKEIKVILDETKNMAAMRLESADYELGFTRERLASIRKGGSASLQRSAPQPEINSVFEILSVED